MAEDGLRRNLDRAFATPPDFRDGLVLSRTMALIQVATPERPGRWIAPRFNARLWQLVAAVMVVVLAVGAIGVLSVLRRTQAPAMPSHLPVIFPTKMITSSVGWAVTERGGPTPQVWRTTDGGL